jgi:hypothetical protein
MNTKHWQDFKDDWLVRDGTILIPYIQPLSFDFPDEAEYNKWQNSGLVDITYRRLIVTVYLQNKNVFRDLFIEEVTRADIEQYLLFINARATLDNVWK